MSSQGPSPVPPSEGAAFDRLRDLFDNLPAAVALVRGPSHVYEFVNPGYRRLLGDRTFEGLSVDDAVPELRPQGFVDLLDEVYRTGEPYVGRESRVVVQHDDGVEEVFVDFIYQPMRGVHGAVEGILGFGMDVTEAVRAREQLTEALRREQEDRFRQAIDNMIDTVLIGKPIRSDDGSITDFLVTFVNRGSDELGGREAAELAGRRFRELWPNVAESGLLARYVEVVETGSAVDLEDYAYADYVAGTDIEAVFDIRASRLGDDLFLVFRDVTERVARERALAESRARLLQEHEMVTSLQAALLPRELPTFPHVDVAAEYLAATEGLEVGGDWFDVFALPDGRVALCVGDVAGKGIDAAQVMAQLRSAGRVAALAGQEPHEVMASKNTLMITGDLAPLATTVFTRYDPTSGEAEWVSAGHLPPLLVPAQGPPALLPTLAEPPLGVVSGQQYSFQRAVLEPGDRLVLYTDGLIERRGENLDQGLERLRSLAPVDADAATTCRRLLDELVPSGRFDDVCVVTLRRTD
jgi:PAS domain S-box-containing protein